MENCIGKSHDRSSVWANWISATTQLSRTDFIQNERETTLSTDNITSWIGPLLSLCPFSSSFVIVFFCTSHIRLVQLLYHFIYQQSSLMVRSLPTWLRDDASISVVLCAISSAEFSNEILLISKSSRQRPNQFHVNDTLSVHHHENGSRIWRMK